MKLDARLTENITNALHNGASKEELLELLRVHPGTGSTVKTLERILYTLRYDYNLDIEYRDKQYKLHHNTGSSKLNASNLFLQYSQIAGEMVDTPDSVDFGPISKTADMTRLRELIVAIKTRNRIMMHYRSFRSDDSTRYSIAPRSLKFWNYRWYLIAVKLPDEDFRIFGVDRIVKLSPTSDFFEKDTYPKVPSHIIGVSNYSEPAEDIVIQIDPYGGQMFQSLSYHPSQRVTKLENGNYKVTWQVAVNKELIELLCSIHQEFKIIKPTSLKVQMNEHIERLSRNLSA